MNKLVSRNPVLRFKLGKKIVKAYRGIDSKKLKLVGSDNWGSPLYFNPSDNKLYSKAWLGGYSYIGDEYKYTDLFGGKSGIIKASDYIQKPKLAPLNIEEETKVLENLNPKSTKLQQQSPTTKPATTGTKVVAKQPASYLFGKMGGWNKSMKNNITDEESLRMLKEMGMENYSAGLVLDEINKLFGTNAVKRDDRWGNLSRAGLKSLYENWKLQNNNSSINLPSKTLNSIIVNQEPITPEQQTEQAIVNNNFKTIENNGQKYFTRTGNYNKSQLRDYMRLMGLNPYDFKGSERKALRLWLNGLSNDSSLLTGRLRDLFVTPYGYKQGGQLVSRNPVKRFKLKNFMLVAQ